MFFLFLLSIGTIKNNFKIILNGLDVSQRHHDVTMCLVDSGVIENFKGTGPRDRIQIF